MMQVGPLSNDMCLYKRHTETTRGAGNVIVEAESTVTQPQAKECPVRPSPPDPRLLASGSVRGNLLLF